VTWFVTRNGVNPRPPAPPSRTSGSCAQACRHGTLDGLEATRRILVGPDPHPRVIVLTTFDLDEYVYEVLRVGASGFLLKEAPEDQLVAAIRVAAVGGSMFAPSVTRRLIEEFARSSTRRGRFQPRSRN
jgi:DNA-binding NarL/FixJ family response regulator